MAAICLAILAIGLFYLGQPAHEPPPQTIDFANAVHQLTAEDFSAWKEFVPQSKLFRVELPYPPQHATDLISMPNSDKKRRFDMYASEKGNGAVFLISVITYPEEVHPSSVEDTLKQTIEELMKHNPDNRLSKSEHTFFDQHPALDFAIANREFLVQGKALLIGRSVYMLSYASRVGEFDAEDYRYFIDSFQPLESAPVIANEPYKSTNNAFSNS